MRKLEALLRGACVLGIGLVLLLPPARGSGPALAACVLLLAAWLVARGINGRNGRA